MKYAAGLLALASLALAKEIPRDPKRHAELYESGLMHDRLMNIKLTQWAEQDEQLAIEAQSRRKANGRLAAEVDPYPEEHFAQCRDGKSIPIRDQPTKFYRCKNVNLHHFVSHWKLGTQTPNLSSSAWGWVAEDGREFALIAQGDGVAFAEITNAGKLRYIGRLPQTAGTPPSRWREIRTYKHYLIVASETFDHHVQIFDLHKLLPLNYKNGPVTFDPAADLTGFFGSLPDGRAHNILSNDDTDFIYVVGARPRTSECCGGLIFLNVTDPANPTQAGCASEDGYVHDAQCLIYKGPDKRYAGREICYGYNEDSLTIYDVTDKEWPEVVSVTSYEGATYSHQGWVLNKEWQEFLVLDDEIDEIDGRNPGTKGRAVTYIWDIRDLQKPKQTGYYQNPRTSNDHNQYVIGNYSYQSNYGDGISILDISSIPSNPTGSGVTEFGWFDVHPDNDNSTTGGSLGYFGTWGSYADYPSGHILVNTMEKGVFVLKIQNPDA